MGVVREREQFIRKIRRDRWPRGKEREERGDDEGDTHCGLGSLGAVACTEYATATALRQRYWRKDGKKTAVSNREGKRVD
jgi:hypothetical protein